MLHGAGQSVYLVVDRFRGGSVYARRGGEDYRRLLDRPDQRPSE